MCGITGYIDFSFATPDGVLDAMTDALVYRGFDSRGTEEKVNDWCKIGLGHRRLSIQDLSPLGHQPFVFKQYSIVFNGEVYNFKEIREELIHKGYTFISGSDTEVILKAFVECGDAAIQKFIGMFAFAIYDSIKQEITLCRDRAGVKPLYYSFHNNVFLFASELKSFRNHPQFNSTVNTSASAKYFQLGYIPAPHTIYEHALKLQPGHILKLDIKRKSFAINKYWDVVDFFNKPKFTSGEEEITKSLEELLISAYKYRMVSDVPVGVFLSGGYDSSNVAAILQKHYGTINTFTIGFEDKKYNEAHFAKEIAKHIGSNHHELMCTEQEAFRLVQRLPIVFDEPFGDSSAIPTLLVCEMARQKVTVALSADGGDELMAGYTKYTSNASLFKSIAKLPSPLRKTLLPLLSIYASLPIQKKEGFKGKINLLHRLLSAYSKENLFRYKIEPAYFSDRDLNELLSFKHQPIQTNFDTFSTLNSFNDDVNKMLAIDYKTYMVDDVLVKVDRAAMAVSLEGREPLLDHRIAEFLAQVPSSLKYHDGCSKYLLKKITHKYVPEHLLNRPKKGFGVPLNRWLKGELKEMLMDFTSEKSLKDAQIFNVHKVQKFRDNYLKGNSDDAEQIWFLLMYQMWYNEWMK